MTTLSTNGVNLLILGAGWLSHFLIPLLDSSNLTHAATSRSGLTPDTIVWNLGDSVEGLPRAQTVVVMFPINEWEDLKCLVEAYENTQGECMWILIGSTRGWQVRTEVCCEIGIRLIPSVDRGPRARNGKSRRLATYACHAVFVLQLRES